MVQEAGWTTGWSGRVHKILPPQGFDSWTIQPVSRVFRGARILGWIYHLVAYWWLRQMCIISDILIEYYICFLRWKKGFWFTVNIGCIETGGSSSAVLHAVADDMLTRYCIVFQRWQRRFWGEDNIVLYIYIYVCVCVYVYTHTHTHIYILTVTLV